jgi:fatty-acyl-CoA synthase
MRFHLVPILEQIAAAAPDRDAIVWRDRRLTYSGFAARTRRLGHAFRRLGLGCHTERDRLRPWESGHDHVALYLHNGTEFLEAMYGTLQARAAFVNVNYRYVAEELDYVLRTATARAVVYHAAFAPTLAAVRDRLPDLAHLIVVPDDSGNAPLPDSIDYETFVAAGSADALDLPYSPDDLYVLYTGGTTGLPKGVLWRQEDVFFNGLGGHIPGFDRIDTDEKLESHVGMGIGGRFIVLPPYMHGAGQWAAFNTFHRGGTVVMPDEVKRLDPKSVWDAVARHRVDQMTLVGDAFAQPLLTELRSRPGDAATLRAIGSTAAVLSPSVKRELMALLPESTMFIESIGASEAGLQAMSWDAASADQALTAYQLRDNTVVLAADRSRVLEPGTEEIGWIATKGHLPLGYLGDPEKTERTFPTVGGVRYSIGGDRARYSADGRLVFLGRESVCINTGGEKVYVEEVERIVKSHPAVWDALVVGVPSPRWGQQVTAVVSLKPGHAAPSAAELREHCRTHLADYKVPKAVVAAPEISRSPSGKPDYAWAAKHAATALAGGDPHVPSVARAVEEG